MECKREHDSIPGSTITYNTIPVLLLLDPASAYGTCTDKDQERQLAADGIQSKARTGRHHETENFLCIGGGPNVREHSAQDTKC